MIEINFFLSLKNSFIQKVYEFVKNLHNSILLSGLACQSMTKEHMTSYNLKIISNFCVSARSKLTKIDYANVKFDEKNNFWQI